MKVRVLESTYCMGVRLTKGEELELDSAIAYAVGSSVEILDKGEEPKVEPKTEPEVKTKAPSAPVADKMVKKNPVKKSASKRKS